MSFESFIRLKKFWDCKYATYIRLALCSNLRVASIMFWSLILTLVQRHNKHARRGNYSSNSEDKIWSFCMTTFWKCPTTSVESTRCAAFPKKRCWLQLQWPQLQFHHAYMLNRKILHHLFSWWQGEILQWELTAQKMVYFITGFYDTNTKYRGKQDNVKDSNSTNI